MKRTTRIWIHKLAAAFIGGGASAITSGLVGMGFAPDKFNLTEFAGIKHLLLLMLANFVVSGFLSAMFYLKQAPLPPIDE
jgi:hypothetical protein